MVQKYENWGSEWLDCVFYLIKFKNKKCLHYALSHRKTEVTF